MCEEDLALRDPEALCSRTMCRHAQMAAVPSSGPPGWRCAAPLKHSQHSKHPTGLFFNLIVFSTNTVISARLGHDWERLGWQHGRGHGHASDEEQTVRGVAMPGTDLLGGQRKRDILENASPSSRLGWTTLQVWQVTSAVAGDT